MLDNKLIELILLNGLFALAHLLYVRIAVGIVANLQSGEYPQNICRDRGTSKWGRFSNL